MTIQNLAETTVESLADNRQPLAEFIAALLAEARAQALRARKEADDYSAEELDFWATIEADTVPAPNPLRLVIKNFLWALDKGYYFTTAGELADSAFTAALRKAVA